MTIKLSPENGGCWFCGGASIRDMVYSDTTQSNVHTNCIRQNLTTTNLDRQQLAQKMAEELGIS